MHNVIRNGKLTDNRILIIEKTRKVLTNVELEFQEAVPSEAYIKVHMQAIIRNLKEGFNL
jgi:hypothetical protein